MLHGEKASTRQPLRNREFEFSHVWISSASQIKKKIKIFSGLDNREGETFANRNKLLKKKDRLTESTTANQAQKCSSTLLQLARSSQTRELV